MNKVLESLLGFKTRRSPILEARNSLLKLLFVALPINILLFVLVNIKVPIAYMDEYFHEDQLQHYMQNDFKYWNGKITTPPGLYYVSYLASFLDPFQTTPLILSRFLNTFLCSNITLVFFMKIFQQLDCNRNNFNRSLLLSLTPTIFFFNFLMYTDALSLMLITCAFYYNLTNSRKRLFVCSLGAVLARQNNIVWLFYLICYRVLMDKNQMILNNKRLISQIISLVKLLFTQKAYIIRQFKYQVLLILGFLFYMRKYNNGQLVFGDSQNHQVAFHPTQLLYLSLFIVINLPLTIRQYIGVGTTLVKRILTSRHALSMFLILIGISLILIDKFTIVHPFITADNRHFIFYIYKNFLSKSIIRYSLCVIYPLAMIFIFRLFVTSEDTFLKIIILASCCALVIVPTPLVEFRYFTIPLVMFSFQIRNKKQSFDIEGIRDLQTFQFIDRMWPMVLSKLIFNLLIFFVFLYLPFGNYNHSRFMW